MSAQAQVFIVDDDYAVRDSLGQLLETFGLAYQTFVSAEQFLQLYQAGPGCLLLDLNMPDMTGDELQVELARRHIHVPIIFLTGYGDIPTTVRVMKAGAVDFFTKPVPSRQLLDRIQDVLAEQTQLYAQALEDQVLHKRLDKLTARELDVLSLVVAGHSNKEIARLLGISHRTVEIHRARVMEKSGATNLLELARFAELCALAPK